MALPDMCLTQVRHIADVRFKLFALNVQVWIVLALLSKLQ